MMQCDTERLSIVFSCSLSSHRAGDRRGVNQHPPLLVLHVHHAGLVLRTDQILLLVPSDPAHNVGGGVEVMRCGGRGEHVVSFGSDGGVRDPASGDAVGPGEECVCFILFLYLSVVEGVDENGGVIPDAASLLSSFFLPRSPCCTAGRSTSRGRRRRRRASWSAPRRPCGGGGSRDTCSGRPPQRLL